MGAFGLGVSLGHIRAVLGLAEVLVARAVVDLAIHPDLTSGGTGCRCRCCGGCGGWCCRRRCLRRGSGARCRCRCGSRLLGKRRKRQKRYQQPKGSELFSRWVPRRSHENTCMLLPTPSPGGVDWGAPAAVVDEMFFTIGKGCERFSTSKLTLVN